MRFVYHTFLWILSLGALGAIAGLAFVVGLFYYYAQDLPDHSQLKNYAPPIVTRLYAEDGRLMVEYAREKRVFVPIEQMPDRVKEAFVAAEDKNFYTHEGVDPMAVARAATIYARHLLGQDVDIVGGSTITQQVVKNFLLTNERSFVRKIKEAILAYRMEQALSKDRILELYLNQIYLGGGSYGVAAAALDYFNKALNELSVAEVAYLAALPKAPNNYHPVENQEAAVARRSYVISRMRDEGFITKKEAVVAEAAPLETVDQLTEDRIGAPYFSEEVRRQLEKKYGEERLYGGGMAVHTSVKPELQKIAVHSLRDGLMVYDKRHGWRGPIARLGSKGDLYQKIEMFDRPDGLIEKWDVAIVTQATASKADLLFPNGTRGLLPFKNAEWTGQNAIDSFLKIGDIIAVERIENSGREFKLQQIPKIQGAIVALDPHTGRVLAMQGGWKYGRDQFNRATQARRQPGSAFKPFVYLTALERGFTPATLVLDAPFVIEDRPGNLWSPENYSGEFYGPTPLRVGIEKSRNLMTVRLAEYVGMDSIIKTAKRFGVVDDMQRHLANALGAGETTLLRLTGGYAQLLNGGKKLTPTFIDRVQNRYGQTVFQHDRRPCPDCGDLIKWADQPVPDIPDIREQIANPRNTYQIVSILEGAVQRGTGVRLKSLNRPLAGKTGTTNDSKDSWFIGFSPNLVVGVFVGFDDPRSLGKRETGSSVALPIFKNFIDKALEDTPPMPFRVPQGVRQVRVDAQDGTRAQPGDEKVIWESFLAGTEPDENVYLLDADGQIRRLPAAIYRDNYITMQDQFVPNDFRGNGIDYTDRYTGSRRENAATTGTGGLY